MSSRDETRRYPMEAWRFCVAEALAAAQRQGAMADEQRHPTALRRL